MLHMYINLAEEFNFCPITSGRRGNVATLVMQMHNDLLCYWESRRSSRFSRRVQVLGGVFQVLGDVMSLLLS